MLRPIGYNFIKSIENNLNANAFRLQFIRWRRKPRWLPVAKSKQFRVPERKPKNPEEYLELLRLHNNYRTQMRSVTAYLREEAQRNLATSTADHLVVTPEQEEEQFQECVTINEAWNAEIAELRNKRIALETTEKKKLILERIEAAKLKEEERLEKADAIIRLEKERSKTYITKDNLDEAIEYALANPVDFNFAIDLKGNIHRGREEGNNQAPDKVLSANG